MNLPPAGERYGGEEGCCDVEVSPVTEEPHDQAEGDGADAPDWDSTQRRAVPDVHELRRVGEGRG